MGGKRGSERGLSPSLFLPLRSESRVFFFFLPPPLSFFRRGSPGSTHARARSHFHRVALPFRTRRTSRKRRARTRGRTRNDVTLRHTNGRRGGRTNRQIGWVGKKIITKRERARERDAHDERSSPGSAICHVSQNDVVLATARKGGSRDLTEFHSACCGLFGKERSRDRSRKGEISHYSENLYIRCPLGEGEREEKGYKPAESAKYSYSFSSVGETFRGKKNPTEDSKVLL